MTTAAVDLPVAVRDGAAYVAAWSRDGEADEGAATRHRLQALFGLWCARLAGDPAAGAELDASAARVRDGIAREDAEDRFDPWSLDPRLLLFADATMRERGLACVPLAEAAAAAAAALASRPDEPLPADGAAAEARRAEPPPAGAHATLLRADAATLRRVCNRIASATDFGLRQPPPEQAAALLPALRALTLQKLREYDLMLGASLLRALVQLGVRAGDDDVDDAVAYLCSQQQADGRFGHYSRELARRPQPLDPARDLYLPVTVSVLWALAEVLDPGSTAAALLPRKDLA